MTFVVAGGSFYYENRYFMLTSYLIKLVCQPGMRTWPGLDAGLIRKIILNWGPTIYGVTNHATLKVGNREHMDGDGLFEGFDAKEVGIG